MDEKYVSLDSESDLVHVIKDDDKWNWFDSDLTHVIEDDDKYMSFDSDLVQVM